MVWRKSYAEETNKQKVVLHQEYRAWRREQMASIAKKTEPKHRLYGQEDEGGDEHSLQKARARIVAFREHVASDLRWSPDAEKMPLIGRALGIPSYLPLARPWWLIAGEILVSLVTPIRFRLFAGRLLLRRVRTYEGRKFVYERIVAPMWGCEKHFSGSIDVALRHLPPPRTVKPFDNLWHLDRGYVTAGIRLGLTRVEDIAGAWRGRRGNLPPCVLHALIDEGVLRTQVDLDWLPKSSSHHGPRHNVIDVAKLREMVHIMLQTGIPRDRAAILLDHSHAYNPARFSTNLALLQARGIADLAGVLDAVGEKLWRVDEAYWLLVVDAVGVRTAEGFKRFRSLLNLTQPAPVEVVEWMREQGASLDDLFEAREFLKHSARKSFPPLATLELLAKRDIPVTDIIHCTNYVLHGEPDQLEAYLDVLTRYGYGDRTSIQAFHQCYTRMGAQVLDFWLGLVGPLNDRAAASVVAKWALRAQARNHSDSLKYIIGKMPPTNLAALNQRLFVMDICLALVRHVVEVQGLNDPKTLNHWYHHEAWGAKDYRGGSEADALDTILIEDAYRRKNFVVLEGNRACLDGVVRERARIQAPYLTDHSEASVKAFQEARKHAEASEREALTPMLPAILAETHGTLLTSAVEAASHSATAMQELLTKLRPLLVDLARGQGPMHETLTDLEVEAVALTYGAHADLIREFWGQATGQEVAWAAWYRHEPYLMRWQHNKLMVKGTLDHGGLQCLADAAVFARRFDDRDGDIFITCKRLRASVMTKQRSDHYALLRHLGVLLAAASDNEQAKEWLSSRLEGLAHLDDESAVAHQEISELTDFLYVGLPDALETGLERFIARFSDEDARHLARRLEIQPHETADAKSMLRTTLQRTRNKVLEVYQRWSAREKDKFKMGGDASHYSTLHAFVSKSPASFFAKQALGLCSWNRVALWQELRHAHLLVFDPQSGKLAGVALLYVEVVPDLDSTRPSLIIRGINPTGALVASHEPYSIVSAFFQLAIELAREHGLAGVAFPSDGGQDLMSNRDDIGKVIRKRYEKRAVSLDRTSTSSNQEHDWRNAPRSIHQTFYAYEQGDGEVETLYAIWADLRMDKSSCEAEESSFAFEFE